MLPVDLLMFVDQIFDELLVDEMSRRLTCECRSVGSLCIYYAPAAGSLENET